MKIKELNEALENLHTIQTTQANMNEKQFAINDRIIKMLEEISKRVRIVEMIINDEAAERVQLTGEN